jgi:uncharacterized protein (DUF1697 family)
MRYAAFLRGVMPGNPAMADLKRAFEAAGFTEVSTLLSSGNVVFTAPAAASASLERRAEAAMAKRLGHAFLTIVRPVDRLRKLIAADPYSRFDIAPDAKRIVTFLRKVPGTMPPLPLERDRVSIFEAQGNEVFSAYRPNPKGPVFMTLLQKTFGNEQTTRTWQTVARVVRSSVIE